MKKFIVIAAALVLGATAFAQETNRDANGNLQYGAYETNKFFDNWFLGIGGGVNFNLDKVGDDQTVNFGMNPHAALNLGKWIDPCLGIRAGYIGWGMVSSQEDPWGREPAEVLNNNLFHGDLLWNISNQFWGYKEKRVYNCIPYLHAGLIYGTMAGREFEAGAGLLNNFRLGNKVALQIDARYAAFRAEQVQGVDEAGALYLTAGLAFNLGKANWTRTATTAAAAAAALAAAEAAKNAAQAAADKAAADAANAQANADALAAQNQALKDALANAGKDNDAINALLAKPMIVYFEIGKTKLSAKEEAHLDYIVKNIMAAGQNAKFIVTGSADSKTGSKKRNQQLCDKRAEYLYNLLVDNYGLSGDNLVVKSCIDANSDASAELNRAVIIEKQ